MRSGWPSWLSVGVRVSGQTLLSRVGGLVWMVGVPRVLEACGSLRGNLQGGRPLLALTACSAAGDPPLCSIPIENILAVEPLEEESFKMKNVSPSPYPPPDPLPRVLVCSWTCEAESPPCLSGRPGPKGFPSKSASGGSCRAPHPDGPPRGPPLLTIRTLANSWGPLLCLCSPDAVGTMGVGDSARVLLGEPLHTLGRRKHAPTPATWSPHPSCAPARRRGGHRVHTGCQDGPLSKRSLQPHAGTVGSWP